MTMTNTKKKMTHRNLCILGAKYMKKYGIKKWEKPTYVVIELNRSNAESPNVQKFIDIQLKNG